MLLLPSLAFGLPHGGAAPPRRDAPKTAIERRADRILGISLTRPQVRVVTAAHKIGHGEEGKDGHTAGLWNYTRPQLRAKAELLKSAGLNRTQRRALMKAGVVGDNLVSRGYTVGRDGSGPYSTYVTRPDGSRESFYGAMVRAGSATSYQDMVRRAPEVRALTDAYHQYESGRR